MIAKKHFVRLVGLALLATLVSGFAGSAQATPVPPAPRKSLINTWVNTDAATKNVRQIIIEPEKTGGITIDAFGACTPTLCEWGSVPARVYGIGSTAKTGASFQSIQRFVADGSETSRTTLLGHLTETKAGPRLTVNELTVSQNDFDSHVIETFKPGPAETPSTTGDSVTSYGFGNQPTEVKGLRGTWKNFGSAGTLTKLKIGGSVDGYPVQAAGTCSTGSCYLGRTIPLMYADSNTSATGRTLLVPFKFTHQKMQLIVTYSNHKGRERLSVAEYHEFTDSSGQSNFRTIETMARA